MLATETKLSVNLVNSTTYNVESKATITLNIVGRTLCILHLRMKNDGLWIDGRKNEWIDDEWKNGWINDEWTNGLVDK